VLVSSERGETWNKLGKAIIITRIILKANWGGSNRWYMGKAAAVIGQLPLFDRRYMPFFL
jgi:hypothetical protein